VGSCRRNSRSAGSCVALLDDDGLEGAEREELLKIIDEGLADAEAGRVEDFSKLIAKMRAPS
jgi:hypothetical protein